MEKQVTVAVKTTRFARELRTEFKKIVWPSLRQTVLYTVAVVLMTAVVAILVYVADLIFQFGLGHL